MIVSNPKRPLDPATEKSKFEVCCDKAAPYVIIFMIGLLSVLIFIALVRYGAYLFGTESNLWYNQFGGI